jgi:hypothetical protein
MATGGQVGQPLVTADAIDSMAVTEFRGRPVVVVGGSGVLRVSDVATGALLGRSLAVPGQDFDALATAQLDNQPAIVSANTFEIRTWDLATRFS